MSRLYVSENGEVAVAWDLDDTLAFTFPGVRASWEQTGVDFGLPIDLAALERERGRPLSEEAAYQFNKLKRPDLIQPGINHYRKIMGQMGIRMATPNPGALESVRHVYQSGGRNIVSTGKIRHLAIGTLANNYMEGFLDVIKQEDIHGDIVDAGKTAIFKEKGVGIYVGDHPRDMASARGVKEWHVIAVGVTTGTHNAAQLKKAGADIVLPTLEGFPAYFDSLLNQPR